jgi:hypothetical protein
MIELTISDIEPYMASEFGSRLEPWGFQPVGKRRWVRSQKALIRELFELQRIGALHSPRWGWSSGLAPSFQAQVFRRQSTDKNAVWDLTVDPIDLTANVPPQAFGVLAGWAMSMITAQMRECAERFVPLAMADFDRVNCIRDFCDLFLERSLLRYRRFAFNAYCQHRLVSGFVLIVTGRRSEGLERIREFCRAEEVDFEDRVLQRCIREAESHPMACGEHGDGGADTSFGFARS